jgi:RND family efflux transporter MFP subunit
MMIDDYPFLSLVTRQDGWLEVEMSRLTVFSQYFRLLALVPVVVALAACDSSTAQQPATARPVLAVSVHYEPLVADRSFVGTVRPRIESDLGFRVGGKVSKRLVEVGAMVNAGEPLATLDEVDLNLQAEQAQAELSAAAGVLAQASAAEGRSKELRQKGWATDAQLDQAKAAGDEARARLNRAQRSVDLTKNSLSYATLVADAPGVVTATLIEPGQVVAPGQAAIRVARLAEKEVVVAIPETLLARAKSGKARVSIWSEPDRQYVVKLRELAPSADPTTRTYLAKFSMLDAGNGVQLGMTATLVLSDAASEHVARLPLSALFDQGSGPSLYVVDSKTGAVTLQHVTVKAYESNDVLISGGVDEGASVVTLGVQKLDPAQKVRVVSSLSF